MKKSELLRALQGEIKRHTFDYFVENPMQTEISPSGSRRDQRT